MLKQLAMSAPAVYTPDFHPEGHMQMWYASPFTRFEPHLMTLIFVLIIGFGLGYFIYIKKKQGEKEAAWQVNHEEKQFQELLAKRTITLQKVLDLEEQFERGEISEEEYEQKQAGYRAYLHKIKQQLNSFLR